MDSVDTLERLALANRVFLTEYPQHEQKLWYQKLKTAFGVQVLRLTLAVFGKEASLDDLLKIAACKTELLARQNEQAHLMPLLYPFVLLQHVPTNFAMVKTYYGLSAAAWKMLSHCPRKTIARLAPFLKQSHCLRWVDLVAKSNTSEPSAILDIFNQGTPGGFGHYEHFWVSGHTQMVERGLARLFIAFCDKRAQAKTPGDKAQISQWLETLGQELYADFLACSRHRTVPIEKNSTFDSLMRRVRARWQTSEELLRAIKGLSNLEFPRFEPTQFESSKCQWTQITDSQSLALEGELMRHCVGSAAYISSCFKGSSFIFHGALKNCSFGGFVTAEFLRQGTGFRCVQIKGRGNSSVSGFWVEEAKALALQLGHLTVSNP